jgi:Icc-related predicted phosphoesterase
LSKSSFIINPEGKVVKINEHNEMITCSYSNPTPWDTPREVCESELERKIESMMVYVKDVENCIFNLHAPPIDSNLDTCVKLDTTVYPPKPIIIGGQPILVGAGSLAVRKAIEKYQPLLSLHGHIHESRGVIKIGKTLCLNPGSEYGEGILRGVIVNLSNKKVLSYQFTSG